MIAALIAELGCTPQAAAWAAGMHGDLVEVDEAGAILTREPPDPSKTD